MNKIKTFSILFAFFASFSLLARGSSARVADMERLQDDNVKIEFVIGDGKKFVLTDDDGMATITTLYSITLAKPSEDLFSGKVQWETLKNQKVAEWPQMRRTIIDQLDRLKSEYQGWMDGADNITRILLQDLIKGVDEVRPKINKNKLTYDEYNYLGEFLRKAARNHSYDINGDYWSLIDSFGGEHNPVGKVLNSRADFVLPDAANFMASKCRTDLEGDVGPLAHKIRTINTDDDVQREGGEATST